MTTGAQLVAEALKYQTKTNPKIRYSVGGTGPLLFDCSGFMQFVHERCGVKLLTSGGGARSAAQERWLKYSGKEISLKEAYATPGALLFRAGHNGMSLGNVDVQSHEARNYDSGVMVASVSFGRFTHAYLHPQVAYDLRKYVPLKLGMNGKLVAELQRALRALGLKGSNGKLLFVDSDYGSYTDFAVRTFQRNNRLFVDGEAGPITQAKLGL